MIYECDKCQSALPPNKTQCPRCGEMFDEPVPPDAEVPAKGFSEKRPTSHVFNSSSKSAQGLDVKQSVGLIGAVVLFIGTFAPIISVPVVGSINYFQNGKGDGSIVIILAVLSAILVLTRRYTGLWVTSALTLGLLAFTYFTLQERLSVAQESVGIELADNPFKEFGNVMLQSIQIQWGWALLVVGALLLLGAAALKSESKTASNVSPQINRTVAIVSGLLLAIIVGGSAAYAQHERVQALDEVKAKVAKEAESKRQQDASIQQTAQAEDQAKQNALNQLTLGTWTWDSTEYSRALVGTIRNNSNRTIGFVSVNFNLLDNDGNKVGTAEDMIASLNPGETWKFKASVFQDAAQRATLDSIKGRAEDGPAPMPALPSDLAPSALPLSQLPADAWPEPKHVPNYLPGKSLDKISIGQTRASVAVSVGRKPDEINQFKDGASEDVWTTSYRDRSGAFDDKVSISVLYRQDEVAQIEFMGTAIEKHLPSFNNLISHNKSLKKVCYGIDTYDDKGQPDGGYVNFYYDDIQQGIAYGSGSMQDVFILTSHPDSIIVHASTTPVVCEVPNAKISVVNGHEADAYQTQAEADKADKAL